MERVADLSDFVDISGIEPVTEPPETGFVVIFWLPDADIAGLDKAHDVVIYTAERVPDAHGFMSRSEAAEHAIETAKDIGLPVAQGIYKHTREVGEQGIDDVEW